MYSPCFIVSNVDLCILIAIHMLPIAGGTFALYSLICRYAKVNMLPNQQPADEHISSFRLKLPTPELKRALRIKETLEKRSASKTLLLLFVLMGTSMIIGDGILTPAISGTQIVTLEHLKGCCMNV